MTLLGAHGRTRTADLILTKDVLYHLSYMGVFCAPERETRLELATFSLEG